MRYAPKSSNRISIHIQSRIVTTTAMTTIQTRAGVKPAGSGGLDMHVTNPAHGGKVTCHTCGGFIEEGDEILYRYPLRSGPDTYFHQKCYNTYEHYYGLDKPID